jgi:hypothetical protein
MRILTIAAASILAASAAAQERKKSDNEKLPGQTWVFVATKGEFERKGEFRTHAKYVYIAEKNVGSIQLKGDDATLVVRANPTLNGRILVKRDGTAWHGVIEHGNGSKWSIVFRPKEETIKEKPERKKGK